MIKKYNETWKMWKWNENAKIYENEVNEVKD